MISTAACAAWCFKGKGSTHATFLSHMCLQHYSEMILPSSKTDGKAASKLSIVPPFVFILKVYTWKFYSGLEQDHNQAHRSLAFLCLVQEQHWQKILGCWQRFVQALYFWTTEKAALQPGRREEACPCSVFRKGSLGQASSSQPGWRFLCGQEVPCSSHGPHLTASGTWSGLWELETSPFAASLEQGLLALVGADMGS